MGRQFFLQDDTFLSDQAGFTHSDGRGFLYFFLDDPILDVFAREWDLDLTAFRRIADDTERWTVDESASEDTQRAQLRALRDQLDAAWQAPETLAHAIEQALAALAAQHGMPPQLLQTLETLPITTTIDPTYYTEGLLAQELHELHAMVQYARLRGATRVRLLVR
ncbi:MAG: hypothetical protein MI924_22135 [Chloroflexales bacterium]|nr:hypothetical protein [Chloroflexales bacterium]